jgi:hypothetical protein
MPVFVCVICNVEKDRDNDFYRSGYSGYCSTCKFCMSEEGKRKTQESKYKFMSLLCGGKEPSCQCCGETDIRFLTTDHKNGRDAEEKGRENKRGFNYQIIWRRVQRGRIKVDLSNYRVLCYNCNCGRMLGECPHKLNNTPLVFSFC